MIRILLVCGLFVAAIVFMVLGVSDMVEWRSDVPFSFDQYFQLFVYSLFTMMVVYNAGRSNKE